MTDHKPTNRVGQIVEFTTDGPAQVTGPDGHEMALAVAGGVVTYVLTEPGEYVFDLGSDKAAEQHTVTAQ